MTQHGFARDCNFKCLECGSSEITFFLEATQETFKNYPFCFELKVRYRLEDRLLNIDYEVKNVDRQEIFFSIGAHPAFETKVLSDYEIHFEKKEEGYFALQNSLVDWSHLLPLTSPTITPTKDTFNKDAFIFKSLKSKHVDLVDKKRHEVIRIHGSNKSFCGIWGKDSVPFICLEPWSGVSDHESHDQNLETKQGIQKLPVGGVFKFSYAIETITTAT